MKGKAIEPTDTATSQRDNLITAIGLLAKLGQMFTPPEFLQIAEIPQPADGEEQPSPQRVREAIKANLKKRAQTTGSRAKFYEHPAELLEYRFDQQIGTIYKNLFAQAEAEEIEDIITEVKALSRPDYYAKHPVYLFALEYIDYLRKVEAGSEQKQPKKPSVNNQPRALITFLRNKKAEPQLLAALKQKFQEGKASTIVPIIRAAQDEKLLINLFSKKALWETLTALLGNIGSRENFSKLLNDPQPDQSKLNEAKNLLNQA